MDFNDKQIEIIDIAEQLFALQGYDGTSVRDIASKANINVAMISYYFGSKEKLLEAILIYKMSGTKLELKSVLDKNISPLQKIDELIAYYIKKIYSNVALYQIMHTEIMHKKREAHMPEISKIKKQNLAYIQAIVDEGFLQGVFKNKIDTAVIPSMIIGTFMYFVNNKHHMMDILQLQNDTAFNHYVENQLVQHIQQSVKGLLLYTT
ncbi:TetR/AcrR family transcriptional regulator [Flavobacterium croceum]|uniref:TetR family transcriptional regulator n=1 Tax=Flavobacterium croceum DSM 17960 TaxID=1121886 RepID=A0A2S4N7T5_9FLAO|nr:TetR family transcriptional regulator [Flavobacterium croceum]POS01762.1 TetR family transcriptional regulator [Flavobacterium croceum DSM 17960]